MLNAPWGVAVTPASFGTFSNAVLIGNFGDGTINAYDTHGNFLGQVADSSGHVIVNPGLWEMVFGSGGTGDANTLYFTAGGADQTSGLFGTLVPAAAVGGPDFSLNLSSLSTTVAPGGSTQLMIGAAAVGGFNSQITLSCSQVAGLTCAFNPATVTPGGAQSQLTISAAATRPPTGYAAPSALAILPGLGLLGTVFTARKRKLAAGRNRLALWIGGLLLLTLSIGFTTACGSNNSNHPPAANQATLMVIGTSGGVTHSTPITVTIN
jgi:hypothetical protein